MLDIGLALIVVLMWIDLDGKYRRNRTRLERMERLQRDPGVVPAELAPVHDLVISGEKLLAVRKYRDITGADLPDARAAVGRIERGRPA